MSQPWHEYTAHDIRDAVRARKVSAVEAAQAALNQIDAVDGKVQAFVDVWHDHALEQAREIDKQIEQGAERGPLAGVPIALKDVLCTRHGTTTCCSKILKGYRSPFDATVVSRLASAGAVFVGKVNMDEFAMGSSTENSAIQCTRNPWNLACVPGGSSGGSAASVAADECAASLGSDTGGSVRLPAAFCGCVGLKPTYGRVSRYGLVAFASSLDQIGPFSKDVEDSALLLNVIAGRDPMDSTSADVPVPDYVAAMRGGVSGLTIGLPKEYFSDALGGEMRELTEKAVKALEDQGAKIIEISLPHTEYAVATYYIVCTAEASANLARYDGVRYGNRASDAQNVRDLYFNTKSAGFGPEVQRRIMLGTYVLSSGYYDAYYLKAQKVRTLIRRDFVRAFEQCQVIAAPTCPTPAFKIGEKTTDPLEMYLTDIYTISVNLAGLPGISVPCGLTADGLPAGLQLLAKPFDEPTLFRAAYAYEQQRDPMPKRPQLV